MIKIGPFFPMVVLLTSVRQSMESIRISVFPKTFLTEIYGLLSLTDLQQYLLVTALQEGIVYGNFHGISQFEIYFCNVSNLYGDANLFQCTKTTEKRPYFAVKWSKIYKRSKETYCCKNKVHK